MNVFLVFFIIKTTSEAINKNLTTFWYEVFRGFIYGRIFYFIMQFNRTIQIASNILGLKSFTKSSFNWKKRSTFESNSIVNYRYRFRQEYRRQYSSQNSNESANNSLWKYGAIATVVSAPILYW